MKDTTLLKIALITSLLGISCLLLIPHEDGYKKISKDNRPGDDIMIEGKISSQKTTERSTIIGISYDCFQDATIFERISLDEGSSVKVYGSLEEDMLLVDRIVVATDAPKSKFYK